MSSIDADRLGDVTVEALERIAFVLGDICEPEDLPGPFDVTLRTRIEISGEIEGHVWLESDNGFACELAASLLGEEPEDVDVSTSGRDALLELANIVGGAVVVELGGEDDDVRLGLPEVVDASASAPAADTGEYSLIAADEGALRVRWVADAGEARAAA